MKRGEIWTVSGARDYAGKPRPAVLLQDDRFDATHSVTVCPLTTNATDTPLLRLPLEPTDLNGLRTRSHLIVDKITTVPRGRVGRRVGHLSDEDLIQLNRAVVVFLGLAGTGSG